MLASIVTHTAAHGQRLGDSRPCALGNPNRLALSAQVLAQDHELVAAVAGDRVAWSEHPLHTLGDLDQDRVTRLVAEAVVDPFEAIEVEKQERDRRGSPPRSADGHIEAIEKQGAVRQAGERIVERPPDPPDLGALTGDRVADRPIQRVWVGGGLDQVVLGTVADGLHPHRWVLGAGEDHDRDIAEARQHGFEHPEGWQLGVWLRGLLGVRLGGEAQDDAVDGHVVKSSRHARHRVSDQHLRVRSNRPADELLEAVGMLHVLAYDKQS